jgi:hypothetical protein
MTRVLIVAAMLLLQGAPVLASEPSPVFAVCQPRLAEKTCPWTCQPVPPDLQARTGSDASVCTLACGADADCARAAVYEASGCGGGGVSCIEGLCVPNARLTQ